MMNTHNKTATRNDKQTKNADWLPGVTINMADDEKDNSRLVRERTEMLNNNPRNHK